MLLGSGLLVWRKLAACAALDIGLIEALGHANESLTSWRGAPTGGCIHGLHFSTSLRIKFAFVTLFICRLGEVGIKRIGLPRKKSPIWPG
jgi:hypothetical protein